MSVEDSDVFNCYSDLWKTNQERESLSYQGIDSASGNMLKLRVAAGDGDATDAEDKAVADAYGNRFRIPLDFELLETHMPFFQSAFGDRLEYDLTFNDYSRVIEATGDSKASYIIENLSLEFDIVN